MESLYLLIPLALIIIVVAVKLLFWAINNGQYEDLDTESQRILFDEPSSAQRTHEETEELKAASLSKPASKSSSSNS